jgi:hypothetical protein
MTGDEKAAGDGDAPLRTPPDTLTPLAKEICGGQQQQQQEESSENYLLSSKEASEEEEVVTDNDSLSGGLQVFLG